MVCIYDEQKDGSKWTRPIESITSKQHRIWVARVDVSYIRILCEAVRAEREGKDAMLGKLAHRADARGPSQRFCQVGFLPSSNRVCITCDIWGIALHQGLVFSWRVGSISGIGRRVSQSDGYGAHRYFEKCLANQTGAGVVRTF